MKKCWKVMQITFVLFLIQCWLCSAAEIEVTKSPLSKLPDNIRQLTYFGERAVWSPDGKSIAFVHRTLGDAFEIELASETIRCLTCAFSNAGFFRVHYLKSGDLILIGPNQVKDREAARWDESEIWLLPKSAAVPIRLNQRLSEGIAVSTHSLLVAWVVSSRQYPQVIKEGVTEIWVAELDLDGPEARLRNKRKVHEDLWPNCWLEAQDFRNQDRELIFSCYQPDNNAEVMGVDLDTGTVVNYTNSPGVYDEPEGIFPSGADVLVECDLQNDKGDHFIDIWKLRLDGTGENYERLTSFSEYAGYKASNPVVSPDGKMMAFQIARSEDPPGVGYGILLYYFGED